MGSLNRLTACKASIKEKSIIKRKPYDSMTSNDLKQWEFLILNFCYRFLIKWPFNKSFLSHFRNQSPRKLLHSADLSIHSLDSSRPSGVSTISWTYLFNGLILKRPVGKHGLDSGLDWTGLWTGLDWTGLDTEYSTIPYSTWRPFQKPLSRLLLGMCEANLVTRPPVSLGDPQQHLKTFVACPKKIARKIQIISVFPALALTKGNTFFEAARVSNLDDVWSNLISLFKHWMGFL